MKSIPDYKKIVLALENYRDEDNDIFISGLGSCDPYVVWNSIKGCGLKKIETVIEKLFTFLEKPSELMGDTDIRGICVWSLSQFGFGKVETLIQSNLLSSNPLLRQGIADLLGLLNDKKVLPYLLVLINDEEDSVLLWSSLSLAKYGNDALDIIKENLKQDVDLNKAIYLMDALQKINTKESDDILLNFIIHSKNSDIKKFYEQIILRGS